MFNNYHPGSIRLSLKKLFQNGKYCDDGWRTHFGYLFSASYIIARRLKTGDTQPAIVLSVSPFIISLYSDEFDAVIFLSYPEEWAGRYQLKEGSRLTVSCSYFVKTQYNTYPDDLIPGEGCSGRFHDLNPYVQLFWGKNEEKIRTHTRFFDEKEWAYVEKLTKRHAFHHRDLVRDGLQHIRGFTTGFLWTE